MRTFGFKETKQLIKVLLNPCKYKAVETLTPSKKYPMVGCAAVYFMQW